MFSKKVLIPGLAALVVGAGSLGAIAASSSEEPIRPAEPSEPAIEAVDTRSAASFGVFEQARSAEDAIPAQAAEKVRDTIPYGGNLALSKRIAWDGSNTVYAVPGRGFICTVLPTADGAVTGCQPTDRIEAGSGTGPALNHSATTDAIYAVVPDGVSEITLTHESGKKTVVAVQNGGYYVEVPTSDPGRTVAYEGSDGKVEQNVPIAPELPFEKDNAGK